ncbi:Na(+)/H(+) antiporter subunit B [Salisediminibacterium halotolerans]|uniref:Multicomponent Na+:H+ antiporter subunit B n=1 Tax=Salisediminibacterium halotolerans TaxID=517425 RepID=A0A1H9S3P2_9BACI|nr:MULTISPECIES: Na(+)/H(+) antiporter subunit B [Salisediminibacterium]RLJ78187.1 multisubunit sodium/proton antiporter MrpB subunit [Actinophytocola xinjiangensis]RPE88474.1 multisubunit sodium/proton antiporter MrpB subunit [Salisediminibacterium halotolerans]TWG37164.1 multisubunit sodium/proton antiporter MrpB subunit [Salisediminibacterium halotolerans]SER79617.1 multicomponent Na+:H+ antiporter subunit B [Salisediminibacterium haloalkalitolerans]GEL08642.1 Na(+)/H(+) antiporter subunit 
MKNTPIQLHVVTRIVAFIILIFSIFLFFAGHNNPGGGFIGGLMTASALVLLYLSFDLKTIKRVLPFDYAYVIGAGLLLATLTGVAGMFFGFPYLTQFFEYFQLPILGETELTTALPFDLGIYLVVVGFTLLVILTVAEDDS